MGGEIAHQLLAKAKLRAQYTIVAAGHGRVIGDQDIRQRSVAHQASQRAEAAFEKPASLNPHLFHGVAP
jgi:hypothetical protein